MITKDLHAYGVRNLRQEKSLRDHGAGSDAGGAREVGGPGVSLTPERTGPSGLDAGSGPGVDWTPGRSRGGSGEGGVCSGPLLGTVWRDGTSHARGQPGWVG